MMHFFTSNYFFYRNFHKASSKCVWWFLLIVTYIGSPINKNQSFVHASELITPSLFQQSTFFLQKKEYQKANKYLNQVIKTKTPSSATFYNLGISYFYLGDSIKAIACFRKSIELNAWNFLSKKALKKLNQNMPLLFHLPKELFLFLIAISLLLLIFSFSKWKITFFIFSLLVTIGYNYQKHQPWHTVKVTTAIRSAPNQKASGLFEFQAGEFVTELSSQPLWTQVKNQKNETGWVQTKHLLSLSM